MLYSTVYTVLLQAFIRWYIGASAAYVLLYTIVYKATYASWLLIIVSNRCEARCMCIGRAGPQCACCTTLDFICIRQLELINCVSVVGGDGDTTMGVVMETDHREG